jgi:hypothetical protein
MNYKKLIGFGILLWITAFAIASVFVGAKAIDSIAAKITVPIVVGIAAFFVGKNLKLKSIPETLKYSVVWIVIGVLLDMAVTVPFTGWGIFAEWNVWLGYFFVLTAPLLATKLSSKN